MYGSLRLSFALLLIVCSGPAYATDADGPAADFDALVQRLDANEFADRQAASDELLRRGTAAFPALEQAAKSDSREVSQRAIEILKKHFEGDDTPTKQAARSSLERLAEDESTRCGRQADLVLNPPPAPSTQFFRPGVARPMVRVAGANVRINAAPARIKRVHVRNNNGVKEIEVEENGRKTKVVEDPQQGIQVEVTEKKDGKETTQKYAAKDAAELKQKHPEASKIYDEFGKQNDGVRIQLGGANMQRLVPGQAIPGQPVPVDDGKTKGIRLEAMQRSLQNIDRHMDQLRRDLPDRPDVRRHLDRLEEHRKQIQKLESDLRKDQG